MARAGMVGKHFGKVLFVTIHNVSNGVGIAARDERSIGASDRSSDL